MVICQMEVSCDGKAPGPLRIAGGHVFDKKVALPTKEKRHSVGNVASAEATEQVFDFGHFEFRPSSYYFAERAAWSTSIALTYLMHGPGRTLTCAMEEHLPMVERPSTQGLPCPVCQVALVMSERQGIEIDYCPQCRGVWLDRGELDKIVERAAAETASPTTRGSFDHGYESHRGGHGYGNHKRRRRKSFFEELFD